MDRAVFVIKPAAIHNEKSIVFKLKSEGCIVLAQKTVLFTRQQAEEAATTYSNVPSKLDQEEKIASFLQGPTSILILSKFNVYGYLKQIITGIDEEESQESDDEPKVSDGCFLALYGDNFQASTDESTAEKEIRTFFPDVEVFPPVAPGFDKSFLQNEIYPTLTAGLVELSKNKPANPVEFLGQWLLDNNPKVPKIVLEEEDAAAETA
ncbi:MAG: hypothetical protein SGCHY_002831 [Lobulomycetales sp.]